MRKPRLYFCTIKPQRGAGGNGSPSFSDKGASQKNFLFRFLRRAVVLFGEGRLINEDRLINMGIVPYNGLLIVQSF